MSKVLLSRFGHLRVHKTESANIRIFATTPQRIDRNQKQCNRMYLCVIWIDAAVHVTVWVWVYCLKTSYVLRWWQCARMRKWLQLPKQVLQGDGMMCLVQHEKLLLVPS